MTVQLFQFIYNYNPSMIFKLLTFQDYLGSYTITFQVRNIYLKAEQSLQIQWFYNKLLKFFNSSSLGRSSIIRDTKMVLNLENIREVRKL